MAPKKKPAAKKRAPTRTPVKKRAHPKARSPTSPMDVLADIRQAKALDLRIQGHNFREIADRLNVTVATAHGYVTAGLAELAEHQHAKATELRAAEIARLDALMRSLWPLATGDTTDMLRKLVDDAEMRGLTPKQLDKALLELPPAGVPHPMAAKRVLECIVARSRLLGLEAPVKHAHTNPDGSEERPPGTYVFPVPPGTTLADWQKLAAAAAKAGSGG